MKSTNPNEPFSLAAYATLYNNPDDPACDVRYIFLNLLLNDPLFPAIEAKMQELQNQYWELTGEPYKNPGSLATLYNQHHPNMKAVSLAMEFSDIQSYLARTWRDAGGGGVPVAMGRAYGIPRSWLHHWIPQWLEPGLEP